MLTIGELADTLEAELSILQLTGPRGDEALADAMVGWSQAADPEGELVFAQLAVFGAAADGDAVAAICDARLTAVETLDVLSSLVSKSLVGRWDDGSRRRGSGCCGWFASTRGPSWLSGTGPTNCGGRHAECFCALAEQAAPHLTTHDQQAWLATIDRELGNIRDAIGWSVQHEPELAYRIIAALGRWCYLRTLRRGPDLGGECAAGLAGAPITLRAPVLQLAGTLAFLQCDYAAATTLMGEAHQLYAAAGDQAGIVSCTSRLGSIAREQGRYAEAERLHSGRRSS